MADRTAYVVTYGFAPSGNVTVDFSLDGTAILTGYAIPTQNTAYDPNAYLTPEAQRGFSWTLPIEFAGTRELSMTVHNGICVVGPVLSNYNLYENTKSPTFFGDIYPPGDCFSNVVIDGVAQTPNPGTMDWWYTMEDGSTLTCTLNIAAGATS